MCKYDILKMTDINSLNSPNYFGCNKCCYYAFTMDEIISHFDSTHSPNHDNTDNTDENSLKIRLFFYCQKCGYKCSKKSDYVKHCKSKKHNQLLTSSTYGDFACECGRTYKHRQSLHSHKLNCSLSIAESSGIEPRKETSTADVHVLTSTIMELVKQNNEFKQLLIDQNKQMLNVGNQNTIGNNNTNNNNKFNLNVFLNEKCKDAISITDFVKSMNISIEDFVQTGELGYVDGISRVMVDRINNMELYDRPLHCTDLKRETVYIKDENKWEKDEDKTRFRKAVKKVANKNSRLTSEWMEKTPDVNTIGTENYENFFKYSQSALGGVGPHQTKSFEDKIMRNIMKEITIDKQTA